VYDACNGRLPTCNSSLINFAFQGGCVVLPTLPPQPPYARPLLPRSRPGSRVRIQRRRGDVCNISFLQTLRASVWARCRASPSSASVATIAVATASRILHQAVLQEKLVQLTAVIIVGESFIFVCYCLSLVVFLFVSSLSFPFPLPISYLHAS